MIISLEINAFSSPFLVIAFSIILLVLLAIVLAGAVFAYYTNIKEDKNEKELAFTELITSINEGKIEKIEMTTGSAAVKVTLAGEGDEKDREKTVVVPSIQAFMELVQEKVDKDNIQIELIQKPVNPILKISDALLKQILKCLTNVRNICAHNDRLFFAPL